MFYPSKMQQRMYKKIRVILFLSTKHIKSSLKSEGDPSLVN